LSLDVVCDHGRNFIRDIFHGRSPVEGNQHYDAALTVLVRSVAIFAISLLPDDCMHPKPAFPLQLTATRAEVRSEVGVGCGLYIE
jgi:hypothetical protein